MNKIIRDGNVAILYSPGFGAGWYTWNEEYPEIIFDPGVVDLLERGEHEQLEGYVNLKWPTIYTGGMADLKIRWLPEGTAFQIEEYDGSESIVVKENVDWFIA